MIFCIEIILCSLVTVGYLGFMWLQTLPENIYGNGYVEFQFSVCNDSHVLKGDIWGEKNNCVDACNRHDDCVGYTRSKLSPGQCILYSKCSPIHDPIQSAYRVTGMKRRPSKYTSLHDPIHDDRLYKSLRDQMYHLQHTTCSSSDTVNVDQGNIDFINTKDFGLQGCLDACAKHNQNPLNERCMAIQHGVDGDRWKCRFYLRCHPIPKRGFVTSVYLHFDNGHDYCDYFAKEDENVCNENEKCQWLSCNGGNCPENHPNTHMCKNACEGLFDIKISDKYLIYKDGTIIPSNQNDEKQFFFFRELKNKPGYGYVELWNTVSNMRLGYLGYALDTNTKYKREEWSGECCDSQCCDGLPSGYTSTGTWCRGGVTGVCKNKRLCGWAWQEYYKCYTYEEQYGKITLSLSRSQPFEWKNDLHIHQQLKYNIHGNQKNTKNIFYIAHGGSKIKTILNRHEKNDNGGGFYMVSGTMDVDKIIHEVSNANKCVI